MTITTINPATETTLATHETQTDQTVDHLIQQSHTAYQAWQNTSFEHRANCLRAVSKRLIQDNDVYATMITEEMGKPISEARQEIEKCAVVCDYYADHAETMLAPKSIRNTHKNSFITYQPLGIILAVMPWNFPFWQVLRFAAPNLMAGNSVLLKHASNVTGSSCLIEKLLQSAGFPEGMFSSLVINTTQIKSIIADHRIKGVTLTGSEGAGAAVASLAGASLKKSTLELGGSDPYLILEDADIDAAVEICANARLKNAGQVCISPKRIIVDQKISALFIQKITTKMQTFTMGDPKLGSTQIGPLAKKESRELVHRQVQASIDAGATCLIGGKIPNTTGYFYPPTLLTGVQPGMPAWEDEIFGPVLCIIEADHTNHAIDIANSSRFGLGAAVFTKDLEKGKNIAQHQLNAGSCFVNSPVTSDPTLPFGGINASGYGRELGREGLLEFMNIKSVCIDAP